MMDRGVIVHPVFAKKIYKSKTVMMSRRVGEQKVWRQLHPNWSVGTNMFVHSEHCDCCLVVANPIPRPEKSSGRMLWPSVSRSHIGDPGAAYLSYLSAICNPSASSYHQHFTQEGCKYHFVFPCFSNFSLHRFIVRIRMIVSFCL